jgi:hypothetical protein
MVFPRISRPQVTPSPGASGDHAGGGELAQLVVEERQESAAAWRSPAAAASRRWVTSDLTAIWVGEREVMGEVLSASNRKLSEFA